MEKGTHIIVSLKDGTILELEQLSNGLYYFDTAVPHIKDKIESPIIDYSMLETVGNNNTYIINNEIEGTDNARKYQEYLFYPSKST